MSAIIPTDFITDSSNPLLQEINVNLEYTSQAVADKFLLNWTQFFALYNGTADPDDLTVRQNMTAALTNLLNLAVAGEPGPVGNPNYPVGTKFLSTEMARDLRLLLESLQTAGIAIPPAATITAIQARLWQSIAAQTPIGKILARGVDSATVGNRSLQALIELEYIKTGSEVLVDSLGSLETALTLTKESLDVLRELQSIHNKVEVVKKDFSAILGAIYTVSDPNHELALTLFDTNGNDQVSVDEIFSKYPGVAAQYLGSPLIPRLPPAEIAAIGIRLTNATEQLNAIIDKFPPDTPSGPLTLLGKLKQVRDDINGTNTNGWIIDNFDNPEVNITGEFQDHLTEAITAAESLNDSQKEEVRRVLFVFEEYYKSAAAILLRITQLVEKIAQGIAR